jgi:hypothetical protein
MKKKATTKKIAKNSKKKLKTTLKPVQKTTTKKKEQKKIKPKEKKTATKKVKAKIKEKPKKVVAKIEKKPKKVIKKLIAEIEKKPEKIVKKVVAKIKKKLKTVTKKFEVKKEEVKVKLEKKPRKVAKKVVAKIKKKILLKPEKKIEIKKIAKKPEKKVEIKKKEVKAETKKKPEKVEKKVVVKIEKKPPLKAIKEVKPRKIIEKPKKKVEIKVKEKLKKVVKKVEAKVELKKPVIQEKYPPTPWETLPAEYGEDSIVLMTVDPNKLFTYWEAREDTLAMHEGNLNVRVYDVTDVEFVGTNANSYFDIAVSERIGSRYMDVSPEKEFITDIGIINPEGIFITIARSNKVLTPRITISEEAVLPQKLYETGLRVGY